MLVPLNVPLPPPVTATLLLGSVPSGGVKRVWRLAAQCSVRGLVVALGAGLLLVAGAVAGGGGTALTLALVVAATLVFFALHSAWRVAQALDTVAETVPLPPQVTADPSGEAELAWPSLSLVVQGEAAVLRDPELEASAGGEPLRAPVDESRRLAEEALATLGLQPTEPTSQD